MMPPGTLFKPNWSNAAFRARRILVPLRLITIASFDGIGKPLRLVDSGGNRHEGRRAPFTLLAQFLAALPQPAAVRPGEASLAAVWLSPWSKS
jgi:hypothetical protein